ncbi:MAG: 2-amino-4-hydroxy-6-hydroxymethyldihydropteridine diphosphokinase [Proteobacteria bacterium]|nr:2-amino-4-hydroxy-6-hydroxymethyldihydropteridine diphosphokinase [Pseudomonadota bacterium]
MRPPTATHRTRPTTPTDAVARAYVGLGSNLAHPRRQLAAAVRRLRGLPRTRVVQVSPNFVTAPVDSFAADGTPAPDYVNAVAELATTLAPRALLAALARIERRQGRMRVPGTRNRPRTLDLDLLLFDARRLRQPTLTLPHPRMHQRAFVLVPLASIAPHARIPGIGLASRARRATRGQPIRRTRTAPSR